jgi:hypothetical protein
LIFAKIVSRLIMVETWKRKETVEDIESKKLVVVKRR